MPGLLKIGRTDRQPELRARELRTTGVPNPFVLEHYVGVEDSALAERQIHQLLQSRGARMANDREFFSIDLYDAIAILDLVAKMKPFAPDFTRAGELGELAATVPIPDALNCSSEKVDLSAAQLAAIARRGYPYAMRQAANLFETHTPSGPRFKQYYREYLELLRADATRHLLASTNGKDVRASVGQAAAEYLYVCSLHRWLIDDDFDFLASFLVSGDQFQYEGYLNELSRFSLPDEIAQRAREL